jgi:CheY-like chemotaxis protein
MSTPDERMRVLVVEDDAWIRSLLADILPAEGYIVEEASNGASAVRMAKEHRPDVVLLDLAMPEMSGLDVWRELKNDSATDEVPVIVVSAYTALLPNDGALSADGVVQKPFDLDVLLEQIKRVTTHPTAG